MCDTRFSIIKTTSWLVFCAILFFYLKLAEIDFLDFYEGSTSVYVFLKGEKFDALPMRTHHFLPLRPSVQLTKSCDHWIPQDKQCWILYSE